MITADKMSNAQYHATDAISSSDVKAVFGKSLAHWKHRAAFKPTIAMAIGTAVHDMCLEDGENTVRGGADRRGKQWSDAFAEAEAHGKLLLTAGDYDLARNVADSVMFHPVGAKMAGPDTVNEASFFAKCPMTGMDIKCRPDSYDEKSGVIFDIKTCQSSAPKDVEADIRKYNYALQVAWYMYVMQNAGYKADRFCFVFVEKTAPFAVNCCELTMEYIDWADVQMHKALRDIKTANDTQVWDSGYSIGINAVDIPPWLAQDAALTDDF